MTNPPFGGEEERGILGNFPVDRQTAETALLFLQLIMRKMRRSTIPGRAGVIVPNGTLFGDGISARIKKELLTEFNLHTLIRLPEGVFSPYTDIPTNILLFDRSGSTKEIWFYEHPLPKIRKKYTKTRPLLYEEFGPLLAWLDHRSETENAWKVSATDILKYDTKGDILTVNLDLKNPRNKEELERRSPQELLEEISKTEHRIFEVVSEITKDFEQQNP
jgi:type I restriction enzyme M protein